MAAFDILNLAKLPLQDESQDNTSSSTNQMILTSICHYLAIIMEMMILKEFLLSFVILDV